MNTQNFTDKEVQQVLNPVIGNGFDANYHLAQLGANVAITQAFDGERIAYKEKLLSEAEAYFIEAREERKKNGGYETEKSLELEAKGNKLSQTASYVDTALGAVWGSAGGTGLIASKVGVLQADYTYNAATHVTAGQVYKIDCSGSAAQYYCKDTQGVNGKQETPLWEGGAKEIYDMSELAKDKDKGNVIISNPGILNSKSDAFRNAVKQNPEAAKNGNLYVVLNNPTYSGIPKVPVSELMYAGYDKLNDQLGAILPITNAEKANVAINSYAKDNGIKLEKSNHSRGGLTESVSLQRTNNNGIKGVPIVESRFFGTAANVEDYIKQTKENGYETTVKQATHKADFVGRPPLILGGNPATGGDCWLCYSHSGYYGEVPSEYLKNADDTYRLDSNGKEIENPEYEKYVDKWGEVEKDKNGNFINLSLPKEVILENGKINFKGEEK